ncbi:MAG TPA: site-2 protease family protein, partial [Egicoccus sp.]
MTGATAIVVFVVAVIESIMIHELGHFLTARWFGMRADRYFLGFGPTLWSTRRGETEYGVKAFPLGGFVTIKGMSPLDERLRPVGEQVFDAYAVDRDLVGGVEHRRPGPAPATGELGEVERTERGAVDRFERQLRHLRPVARDERVRQTVGPGHGELDRQAHVGRG